MTSFQHKKKFIGSLFFSYFILVLISTALTTGISHTNYKQMKENIVQMQLQSINQSKSNIDEHLINIKTEMLALSNNRQLSGYAALTEKITNPDYSSILNMTRYLREIGNNQQYFIAHRNSRHVISRTSYTFEQFYDIVIDSDIITFDDFYEQLFNSDTFLGPILLAARGGSESKQVYLIKQSMGLDIQHPEAFMFCFIETKDLINKMGGMNQESDGNVILLGESQNVIDSQFPVESFADISAHLFQTLESDFAPWSYTIIQPDRILMKPLNDSLLLLGSLIAGGFIILCIIAGASLFYNSKAYNTLITTNTNLQIQLEKQIPYVRQDFFKCILEGTFDSWDQIEITAKLAEVKLPKQHCIVLVAEICEKDKSGKLHEDVDNIRIHILKIKNLLEKNSHMIYFYHTNYNRFAILCAIADSASQDTALSVFEKEILQYEKSAQNINVYIGVGQPQTELTGISESYKQAQRALLNASTYSRTNIQHFPSVTLDDDSYSINEQEKNLLFNYMCSGQLEKVNETFRLLVLENVMNKNLNENTYQLFLFEFYQLFYQFKNTIPVEDEKLTNDLEQFLSGFMISENIYRIHNVKDLLSRVTEYVEKRKNNLLEQKESIITKIKEYIDNNYNDCELCLQSLAEQYQVSSSYISQLFKKNLSINFYQYLENLRLGHARDLLVSSAAPVKKIMEMSGYSSMNTFDRAFKRKYGLSPSDYRQLYTEK